MRLYLRIVLLLACSALFAVSLLAQETLPDLVRRIKPSAVGIEAFDAKGNSVSRGSGFFIAADRVITNRHVIEHSSRVEVHLQDGKKFLVKGVIATDGEGDIALLQVEMPKGLAVPLFLSEAVPREGESIVVIGNPFGLEGSVSNGIVSAVRDISGYGRIIQITAPISPGSSGSPVVNMRGQVIGIATLQAGEGQNLNFAVPAERILQLKISDLRTVSAVSADSNRSRRANAERFYSQGVAQLSLDDCSKAVVNFQKATEIDPTYAEAWYQSGFCYGVLGRYQDALRASQQAVKLRPEWPETFINIGAAHYSLGNYNDAAEAYGRALKLDDDNVDLLYAYGLTLDKLGSWDREIAAYKRALAIKPDHANALEMLGKTYIQVRRYAEAARTFEQLLIYRPEGKTYDLLGESYLELGKLDESLTAFNNAVAYDPNLEQARYNLGRTYLKLKNPDMARVQYEILKNSKSDWADKLFALLDQ